MNDNRPIWLIRLFQLFVILGSVLVLANTIDILLNPLAPLPSSPTILRPIYGLVLAPLTIGLGTLCVRRVPQNIIGWMLIVMGYGTSTLAVRLDLVLDFSILGVIASQSIGLFWMSYLLIFLYFPSGKLFPERLNHYGNWLLLFTFLILFTLPVLFQPHIDSGTNLTVPNPLAISDWDYTVVTIPVGIVVILSGLTTLVARYRYGTIVERRQLRWLILGFSIQFVPILLNISFFSDLLAASGLNSIVVSTINTFATPFAVGNAILRHKLYDIDIIIRRTLIYSVLTGILAGVYFGGVIITQQLFQSITGETPDIAIVLSTLLIAALFNPLRRRIQDMIDRRLYRRKYDVEQTIAQFNQTLRDEVDVATLQVNLIHVVSETMQPDKIALWVKESK